MADENSFDDLVDEALENAQEDRSIAKEAFKKMEPIFNIEVDDPSTMQAVMLTGQQAVKLIESMSRSNEQIIKLAQLKQKAKPKIEDDEEDGPVDMEQLREEMKTKIKNG